MRQLIATGFALALAATALAPLPARAAEDLRVILQADPNAQEAVVLPDNTFEAGVTASLSRDDSYVVAAGSWSGIITVWDLADGNIVDRIQLPVGSFNGGLVGTPAMSSDHKRITVEAFLKQPSPYTCQRVRFTVTLADHAINQDILQSSPSGEGERLVAFKDPLCNFALRDPTPPPPPPSDANGWRVKVLPAAQIAGAASTGANLGLQVVDSGGHVVRTLAKAIPDQLLTAALSPDSRYFAYINRADSVARAQSAAPQITISVFDLVAANFLDPIVVTGDPDLFQSRLAWRDATHLAVLWSLQAGAQHTKTAPPDSHIFDITRSDARDVAVPGRCFTALLADGSLIGADLSNCVTGAPRGPALWRFVVAKGWMPLVIPELAFLPVDAIEPSANPARVAVVTELHDRPKPVLAGVRVVDLARRHVVATALTRDVAGAQPVVYLRDGSLLISTYAQQTEKRILLWHPGKDDPRLLHSDPLSGYGAASRLFSDGQTLLATQSYNLDRIDIASGQSLSPLTLTDAVSGGFTRDGKLVWAASSHDGVQFWNSADWSPVLSLHFLANQHFFAVAPSGRYDTNYAPDVDAFRWQVRDAPLQSLEPQTFMRDYFSPRLAAKALDGSERNDPIPSVINLDRVLPRVQIADIAPGPTPDTALVSLSVREGVDLDAVNGKTRSGIYNLRLFRNNVLIAQWPSSQPIDANNLTEWRQDNQLKPGSDGLYHATYLAHLPTAVDAATTTFSAYAFNTDRVKSDTVRQTYTRPAMTAHQRHAYVLTIGINAYVEPRLSLHYAASDAQLLAERLGHLPGYDVKQVVLAGTADPSSHPVTKALIAAALDLLAGGDRKADLAKLAAAGADGSGFAATTPDDLVVISFSGHGWADPHGNFYLLPADARWPDTALTPDTASLVSSAELTAWLRGIDAGAMAMVIDACHSAASVATSGFRPGPMGDPGLGQLAYDKGIRILAATQTDDVAMENADLGQGLLTYALAGEGIDASGFGKADLNADRQIRLDEWLRYALRRLPALSTDPRLRHFGTGLGAKATFTVISDSQALPPKRQAPALFDFNARPSPEALRVKDQNAK